MESYVATPVELLQTVMEVEVESQLSFQAENSAATTANLLLQYVTDAQAEEAPNQSEK